MNADETVETTLIVHLLHFIEQFNNNDKILHLIPSTYLSKLFLHLSPITSLEIQQIVGLLSLVENGG